MTNFLRLFPAVPSVAVAAAFATYPALAGPCSSDISDLRKTISSKDAGSGPVVVPGGAEKTQSGISEGMNAARMDPTDHSTATTNTTQAPTNATSAADVRRQQEQQPTSAQEARGTAAPTEDRMTTIENAVKRAEQLDAQNNQDCHAAVTEARNMIGERTKQ